MTADITNRLRESANMVRGAYIQGRMDIAAIVIDGLRAALERRTRALLVNAAILKVIINNPKAWGLCEQSRFNIGAGLGSFSIAEALDMADAALDSGGEETDTADSADLCGND